jgi:hypothetical protein
VHIYSLCSSAMKYVSCKRILLFSTARITIICSDSTDSILFFYFIIFTFTQMCIHCLGHLTPTSSPTPMLLPCTCALQPTLIHLCQTSSLLPSPLPIVISASLRLLYLLLCSEHINHIQVLGFFPFSSSSCYTFSP